MVAELFGLKSHGQLTGAILLISVIGGTISPILSGYIFDVNGSYQLAFFLIFGFSIIGLSLSFILKRYAPVQTAK